MSRVYFHSREGDAELRGSERAHLSWLAHSAACAYWDLDSPSALERAPEIAALVARGAEDSYLHEAAEAARAEHRRNLDNHIAARERGLGWSVNTTYDAQRRLISSLKLALSGGGLPLEVAGVELSSRDVELNTALAIGGEPLALAAKIHGWCEEHCWVEGPDRAWLAGVIDEGLRLGLYRRNLGGESQGWESITELLRSRADGPVVLSFSICEQFPDAGISTLTPPWPEGTPREWNALTAEQRAERERARDLWYDLPEDEQWETALAGLCAERSWAQLTPTNLRTTTFGVGVTVFDLVAPDRDERVRRAAGLVSDDEK